jgi:septal ring factor EnvC (AmiA/AmiB activator)
MKKLVLAMVFILLMALFIAFNYLLWDRENRVKELSDLQSVNANKSADISVQNREIKSLEEENNNLQLKINQLESDKEQLTKGRNDLSVEKDSLNRVITGKNDLLNALKQISDVNELEQPVKKWVDAINASDYSTA